MRKFEREIIPARSSGYLGFVGIFVFFSRLEGYCMGYKMPYQEDCRTCPHWAIRIVSAIILAGA